MERLTENQKKKINKIKQKMFNELEKFDKLESQNQKEISSMLDSGQGNPIISKYLKEMKKVIYDSTK